VDPVDNEGHAICAKAKLPEPLQGEADVREETNCPLDKYGRER
jgi:hypothetical protein